MIANEKPLPKAIRVNTLKIEADSLVRKLKKKGFELERIPWVKDGFWIRKSRLSIGATEEYLLGYYFIQTSASMLPPIVLDPSPNDVVVDMCAAPGGKTTHIAQLMKNKGNIISIELNGRRALSLENNISRCGVKNTIILKKDASTFYKFNFKVDKILLDAPCTGEGLIRVKPERKTSRTISDIIFCSNNQKNLISSAINALKIGGYLVYSTCSLAPEENEEIIDYVIKNFPVEVVPINTIGDPGLREFNGKQYNPAIKYAKRIYPHKYDSIGFFICKLIKKADTHEDSR